ncbi:hypothetical protein CDN98_01795 [Roseateles terrae]|nr:hypothetical protein CDN98_01795 [Roseateles terrae]
MSEVIESASNHAHAPEVTDATSAAGGNAPSASRVTPSAPPSVVLSATPMKPAPQATAQPLLDRHWCMSSRLPFVPAHFLVLPDGLRMPAVGQSDWCDPLGPETARINATPLSLRPADAQRPGHTRSLREGVTNWSQLMKQPVVLQMQSVVQPNSRAAGGFATALLATGTTDLIAVDALVRHPDAAEAAGPAAAHGKTPALTQKAPGFPVAFPLDNPLTDAVTDSCRYAFPAESPYTSVKTETVAPTKRKGGIPQGQLTISLEGADGRCFQHRVRTHTLNLNSPHWAHQLLYALNVRFLESDKKPLQLALMCKDGATASGAVATALHGMECLEALNRGDLHMPDEAALAARLDDFIRAGQSVRSPEFAKVDGKPVDTRRMARDLWQAWASLQSKPDSVAVQTLRRHQLDEGVWLNSDDTTPLLDAVDGATTSTETAAPSGTRQSRLARLLSSSSEDSGVLSDTTLASSQFSTLARGRGAAALPPMQEVGDGEGDRWADVDAAVQSPVTSPAATLPRAVKGQVADVTVDSAADVTVDSVVHATATRTVPRTPARAIDLPTTEGRRARIFHPAHRATDAKVQAMVAHLTAPASDAAAARTRSPASASSRASDLWNASGSTPRGVFATSGARAKPPLTPLQTALSLAESRSAAQGASVDDLYRIPKPIRKLWMPGGSKFTEFLPRLDGLVNEMTARTGLVGFLRARFTDPLTRTLEPHTHWARELIEQVQAEVTRDLQSRAGPSSEAPPDVDQTLVATAAHEAVKQLVSRRFEQLTPREQTRWRERVDGRSPRFELALSSSQQRVHELPRRLSPNSPQADAPLAAPPLKAPPIFMRRHKDRPDAARPVADGDALRQRSAEGLRSPEGIRQMVDREWSTHWVLSLARDVAGTRR